ncbi:zinc-binding alcohol dehydrogenase family protein [Paenibacillus sp. Marseille-Q4541]|uniref:zinc-binding alcohol dehydrogenase family protein n=1 Tax=Paenibacillus sp. Marseille-Q4541 TaxID=2831522 RepID=UPI001BACFC12|nr:zinc-binding alcohol dehydrogenase family protein [Paenibacillus sp. Marseille-Q4541]
MKAVGLHRYLPIEDPESLIDLEIEKPSPSGRDILVKVLAVSVNPVDTKVRAPKDKTEEQPKILGYDVAGIVEEVGESCSLFKPGDEVFYAGSITRQGGNSEFHLVDERIVGRKPSTLNFAEAAALPLTGLTAWEGLFDRMCISENTADNQNKTLLIISGAGGVGSIATQLGKNAGLTVIGTASRPESSDWVLKQGADHVINHRKDLVSQVKELGYKYIDFIYCLNSTGQHFEAMCELIAPQGKIGTIVESSHPLDLSPLKSKSAGFVWEYMFTRAMYETEDMIRQHEILNILSSLVDEGKIRTTLTKKLEPIHAANLRDAHTIVEQGDMIGKLVLEHF